MKQVKRKSILFYNFPKRISNFYYNKSRDWLVKFFSNYEDVIGIYEYGTVKNPGISDLDIIVVLADNLVNKNLSQNFDSLIIPKFMQSFAEEGFFKIIPKKSFPEITLLGGEEFRNIYSQEKLETREISESIKLEVKVATVMDWLPERVLTLLLLYKSKRLSVIQLLRYLRSLTISLDYVSEIIGTYDESHLFISMLTKLRKFWFHRSLEENLDILIDLIHLGIGIGKKEICRFSRFLLKFEYYNLPRINKEAFFFFSKGKGFLFSPNNESEVKFFSHRGVLRVPSIWLVHFLALSRSDKILGAGFRRNLLVSKRDEVEIKIAPRLIRIIRKRMNLCEKIAAYCKKYNFSASRLYRFAYVY